VWVTNDPAVQAFVRDDWLPKVQYAFPPLAIRRSHHGIARPL
jgi:hypothetical protein